MLLLTMGAMAQTGKGQFSVEGGYGISLASPPSLTDKNHYNVGARYMINEYWGVKAGYSHNKFRTDATPSTGMDYDRFTAEAVYNLGRKLYLPGYTGGYVNLLAHAGFGYTYSKSTQVKYTDNIGNITFGLTPQVYIIRNLTLHADFAYVLNIRQHDDFDGFPHYENNVAKPFLGSLFNASIGLTLYLGKTGSDSDWR